MFVVTVNFSVKPDRLAEFMPHMLENARTSLEDQPGCTHFDVCQAPDHPDAVFLYEIYDDAAAFEKHLQTPHFRTFAATTEPMIASKSVQTFALVAETSA